MKLLQKSKRPVCSDPLLESKCSNASRLHAARLGHQAWVKPGWMDAQGCLADPNHTAPALPCPALPAGAAMRALHALALLCGLHSLLLHLPAVLQVAGRYERVLAGGYWQMPLPDLPSLLCISSLILPSCFSHSASSLEACGVSFWVCVTEHPVLLLLGCPYIMRTNLHIVLSWPHGCCR